jgi:EAL domain-containing protein (putative c-di-GMP-specific phosphodiesterase class I)
MHSGEFCSMEALIRLREPDGSYISPSEFIPVAEQTGMVAPITWFILDEACRLLKEHPELGVASVGINLPMAQLLDKSFMIRLNSIVDGAGIAHRRICLEFTERAILENFQQTLDIMETLTQQGYRFFLDDFGMGYSNFNCLLKLPFTTVKLDRSLTSTVLSNKNEQNIVYMLTELFHRMDLKVVAEGAETEDQVNVLKEFGVDRIQGYYYAKAMDIKKIIAFNDKYPVDRYY